VSEYLGGRGDLLLALSKAQAKITGAVKGVENSFFKSKYADLSAVLDAIREPFAENDLCVAQIMEPIEGGFALVTILGHKSGQELHSRLPVYLVDTKPQAVGSQITYARRYALAAIAGVAQVDDDGEAAHGRSGRKGTDQSTAAETSAPPISEDVKVALRDAAAEGMPALKAAWKELAPETRDLVTKFHGAWWTETKASAKS
jgi:hypothetical protein